MSFCLVTIGMFHDSWGCALFCYSACQASARDQQKKVFNVVKDEKFVCTMSAYPLSFDHGEYSFVPLKYNH
ncbi:hypothetical protein L1887_26550 [Cichorium endivia]|nr:hypothetical protein L1887_26550 [Cichorium endivia]